MLLSKRIKDLVVCFFFFLVFFIRPRMGRAGALCQLSWKGIKSEVWSGKRPHTEQVSEAVCVDCPAVHPVQSPSLRGDYTSPTCWTHM